MVKFQIASDFHIEIDHRENIPLREYIIPSADVLILAGDIGRIHKFDQLKKFLVQLCPQFQIVLYVLGNHEFYRVRNTEEKSMDDLIVTVKSLEQEIPNLYILDRSSVIIEDVCVIGTTLWSNSTVEIPPFVRISGMNLDRYNTMFKQNVDYISQMVEYCVEKKLKPMVVTHHCPTYSAIGKKDFDRYKSLYVSNLDYLLQTSKIHTWVYGHTHKNMDIYFQKKTRVISNQKGKGKDTDFSLNKVISV